MSDHEPPDPGDGPTGPTDPTAPIDPAGPTDPTAPADLGESDPADPGAEEGMSPAVRFAIVVGAILVLVLGWWALNRDADTPEEEVTATASPTASATSTATPSPSATPTPSPTPSATPTASASPTSSTTPTPAPTTQPPTAPAAGSLVVATRDGVVVVDGATSTPVAGITGPVELAFADGAGGVVVQVDDSAIARVADGMATQVVQLDDFDDLDADGVSVSPSAIHLMDVDATTGLMVFTVDHLDAGTPNQDMRTQSIVAATDGSDQQVVATDELFEGGIEHALGGSRRATNLSSESSGELLVFEDGGEISLDWDTTYDVIPRTTTILRAPQLDDTGDRLAVTTIDPDDNWAVQVVDTVSGVEEFSVEVGAGTATIDLTDTTLVWWDGTRSTVVDLASGETREVTGRATIVR